MITDTTPHYAAFISYAHADEAVAARLHKALETYPVPKHLRREGRTTRPIFRDVAELTAAHSLSEKIRDAVNGSRVLIVLCSPAAKASHWVNEEIKLFREIHGDGAILSALIEGTPATSFPEALIQGGREPLAASLGTSNAGFKLGVIQLAAGILGTGLDELVQRGAKRRTRRMGIGLAASLAFSALMGFTAYQAVDARNEAELERGESEALLEYMVEDLKFKLEPVGRLELLEGVGRKAIEYYEKKKIDELSDDSLRLLAAARQVIAQVALDAGRMEEAQREIEASAALTREVLARNPDNTDAIYAHAQSEFWVGKYYRRQGKFDEMVAPWREYDRLSQNLYYKDPTNFDWVMEAAWGKNNLGILASQSSRKETVSVALDDYTKAIRLFEKAIALNSKSKLAKTELANAMSGKARILLALEPAPVARDYQRKYIDFRTSLTELHPNDILLTHDLLLDEIDYFSKFFLKLGVKEKKELANLINKIFELTKYDPDNLQFAKFFVQSVCNTFENYDEVELTKRKSQVIFLLKSLEMDDSFDINYHTSMLELLDIKIDILNGKKQIAKLKLESLSEIYSNKSIFSVNDWRVLYTIFLRSQDLDMKDNTKKFSRLFLEEINKSIKLDFPTILFGKLKTNIALENCETAAPLARQLEARGYLKVGKMNVTNCQ